MSFPLTGAVFFVLLGHAWILNMQLANSKPICRMRLAKTNWIHCTMTSSQKQCAKAFTTAALLSWHRTIVQPLVSRVTRTTSQLSIWSTAWRVTGKPSMFDVFKVQIFSKFELYEIQNKPLCSDVNEKVQVTILVHGFNVSHLWSSSTTRLF